MKVDDGRVGAGWVGVSAGVDDVTVGENRKVSFEVSTSSPWPRTGVNVRNDRYAVVGRRGFLIVYYLRLSLYERISGFL